jgi:alginate O-acetyltransferase complex protein AlgI
MLITSLVFLVLAFASAMLYHRLPTRLRNPWLLILSVAFIATWSWQFVIILAAYGLVNFWLGLRVEKSAASSKRGWMVGGIIFNILTLFVFKYNHFFLPALNSLLVKVGFQTPENALQILLPVGLSFLIVQAVSYLVDIANKRLKAENSLLNFGVYILYFPKLLSGPVERARLFLPRLKSPLPFDKPLFERSLSLIAIGLVRKLVFANPLFGLIPESAFTTPQDFAGQHLWLWLIAYAFALFNDFAGYTSIIRGVSLWFGIELTNNFNLPYFSRNFTEFWNRWHISLSNWLRDYIFFPVSRALMRRYSQREHVFNLLVPPLITMFVSGLWHGLSWGLLVWGGLHGAYLVLERLPGLIHPSAPLDERPRWRQGLGIMLTFFFTLMAWVPFRMELPVALRYWKGLFQWVRPDFALLQRYLSEETPFVYWSPLNLPNPFLLLLIAAAIAFDLLLHKKGVEKELWSLPRLLQVVVIAILLLAALATVFVDTTAPFVYQAF